jgi:DNA-binding NarL/FixJ family response regulator
MHALIIEPQSLLQLMLEDELRQLGFTSFDSAATMKGAIAAAERRTPDLITASLRLMDGNGIDAVDVICSSEPIPTIYIVSNPQEAREALEGDVFILKPVSKVALGKAVEQVMVKARPSPTTRTRPSA